MSDANQLELALLNLAVNARDAMPNGGALSIAARLVADRNARSEAAHYLVDLTITDQGTGMTEEVRVRAIEPFFTTKPVGHGRVLGLSQVYGVVRESGGSMNIDSAVGRGTTVHLLLPQAKDPVKPVMRAQVAGPSPETSEQSLLRSRSRSACSSLTTITSYAASSRTPCETWGCAPWRQTAGARRSRCSRP